MAANDDRDYTEKSRLEGTVGRCRPFSKRRVIERRGTDLIAGADGEPSIRDRKCNL